VNQGDILEIHYTDDAGNPEGGITTGVGIDIVWQKGPLGRGEERIPPNGAFAESVIAAALGRLRYYQDSKFACTPNAVAIDHLERALRALDERTRDREQRQVEGTHQE
jgi:hypothetical protein